MQKNQSKFLPIIIVVILFSIFGKTLIQFIADYFWFESLGYLQIYLRVMYWKALMFISATVFSFILLYLNFAIASKRDPKTPKQIDENLYELPNPNNIKNLKTIILGSAIGISTLTGISAVNFWQNAALFLNSSNFNIKDPIFERDLGYYIFQLPFLKYLYSLLNLEILIIFLGVLFIYLFGNQFKITQKKLVFPVFKARAHILLLLGLFFLTKVLGYKLEMFNLLFSHRGILYGATFADMYALLPVFKLLGIISIIIFVVSIASIYLKRLTPLFSLLIIFFIVSIGGTLFYPMFVQRFMVEPNELEKETPFLKNSIRFTLLGYNLENIDIKQFNVAQDLDLNDIKENELTIKNICLWEQGPALETFAQLQEIRSYYDFVDIYNDRYIINGEYRQTMLSPRELNWHRLPEISKTWQNEHLVYTHGYGLCMSPVNRVTDEGLPELFIKDIPPTSISDITLKHPQIYFGELTDNYCLVNTTTKELEYPSGDNNVYTNYEGTGGVIIDSLFKRAVFALYFNDINILISNNISPKSRIMYNRLILERLNKIAPWLEFEEKPYLVIGDDYLYWICDAYTTSTNFPYSQPQKNGTNYVRNSVKVVCNTYSGEVNFYVSDETDPIIKTYSSIFPGLFLPMSKMNETLKKHLRYPVKYFKLQAEIYATFHMKDPGVFYNKEDLWRLPSRGNNNMEPYYTILRFPDGKNEEFILMIPFTPAQKENMTSWLAARCDIPNYGELVLYQFPKQKMIYGPTQIDARINQDSEISKQFTLWRSGGSSVIQGGLIVVPIKDSLLYIEPIYIAAEERSIPELKRVIVCYKDKIAMEKNLEKSLRAVFSQDEENIPVNIEIKVGEKGTETTWKELSSKAWKLLLDAENAMKNGNWSLYGETLKELKKTLETLNGLSK